MVSDFFIPSIPYHYGNLLAPLSAKSLKGDRVTEYNSILRASGSMTVLLRWFHLDFFCFLSKTTDETNLRYSAKFNKSGKIEGIKV